MNKKDEIEVIEAGTENVHQSDALNCCWPPGTMNWEMPEPD